MGRGFTFFLEVNRVDFSNHRLKTAEMKIFPARSVVIGLLPVYQWTIYREKRLSASPGSWMCGL